MNRRLTAMMAGLVLAMALGQVRAQPSIGVFLDGLLVQPGKSNPGFWVTGQGGDQELVVDVHVALLAPDGTIYEYPDWNTNKRPWLPSFTLRPGVKVNPIRLADLGDLPFPLTPGRWRLAGALTRPGTLEFVSLNLQPFFVTGDETGAAGDGFRIGTLALSDFRIATATFGIPATEQLTQTAVGLFSESCPEGAIGELSDEALKQALEEQAIDECQIIADQTDPNPPPESPSCGQPVDLDAGAQLLLSSDRGDSVAVPRQGTSYSAQLVEGFFQGGALYTFSGDGGLDVGPFRTSQRAAGRLELSQPDLLSGAATLDPSSALTVNWNGNSGRGTVFVTLVATQNNLDQLGPLGTDPLALDPSALLGTTRIVHCRFADDGEGTVPANLIRQLTEGLSNASLIPPVTMSAFRYQTTFFNTDRNDLDLGMFNLISGVAGTMSLSNLSARNQRISPPRAKVRPSSDTPAVADPPRTRSGPAGTVPFPRARITR